MIVKQTFTWDGLNAQAVARRLDLRNVWMYAEVESTQDIAHELAEKGAAPGSLVVADAQRAGRGRQGRSWSSQPGRGVWSTTVVRPTDARALDVLSLRIGLRLAEALDAFSSERVGVKWPNDLVIPVIPGAAKKRGSTPEASLRVRPTIASSANLQFRKLAGILCEARWSGSSLSWVAVGVGVNVAQPTDIPDAAGLRSGTARVDVLAAIVTAVRDSAAQDGLLTDDELARYAARDTLKGRKILTPGAGTVAGVDHTGALLVETADGVERHRTGTVSYPETNP